MSRCRTLLGLVLVLPASPLAAQTVTGVRDLNFGFVIRGVQTSVAPSDPIRSGQFYVRYVIGGRVQLRFTLPAVLNRVGGGATMPIRFRNNDGIARGTAPSSVPITFNPNAVTTFRLVTSPDFNVWLGGQVSPSGTQATGTYVGTIVLTCTFF
jgi:hypothetical protein